MTVTPFTRRLLQRFGRLTWLRFGIRDRLIRLVHHPDTCEAEQFTIPFFGASYSGNFDTFIDWCVFYYGAYCAEHLQLIDDLLKTLEAPVFVDVGANVGHHTLFAAMRSKQVISFEPFPEVAARLLQKVSDNDLTNVYFIPCGLGVRNELAEYRKPRGHNTGTGSFSKNQGPGAESIPLAIRVGDEVLAEHGYGHDTIHFLKIDTEGFEPFVLRGLKTTLTRSRPLVFFEWTNADNPDLGCNPRELFPADYRFFRLVDDTPVLWLFRRPTYFLEPLGDEWPDGELLALPREYLERLRIDGLPTHAAARAKLLAGKGTPARIRRRARARRHRA